MKKLLAIEISNFGSVHPVYCPRFVLRIIEREKIAGMPIAVLFVKGATTSLSSPQLVHEKVQRL